MRNLAVEYGPQNVRVNALAPAIIRTDFARKLWEDPEIYARATGGYPLRRIGEPDEVAGAAVFLASRAGAFITGQVITIDGGMTIGGEELADHVTRPRTAPPRLGRRRCTSSRRRASRRGACPR